MALPSGTNKNFEEAHKLSDLDSDEFAQHHTLGIRPGQAAPGIHDHPKAWTNLDPVVIQSSGWALSDFGDSVTGTEHSGDTTGFYRVFGGIVEGYQLAVQNGNGPSFPPAAAQRTWVQLPVASNLRSRFIVGTFFYMNYLGDSIAAGVLRYDKVPGAGLALLSSLINSNNQYSLALYWRYPDLP